MQVAAVLKTGYKLSPCGYGIRWEIGLLFGDFEIPFSVVVVPTTAHGAVIHLTVDNVMNVATSPAFGIGFHVDRAGLRIKGAILQSDCIGPGVHRTSQGFAVVLELDCYLVSVGGAGSPIAAPGSGQRVCCVGRCDDDSSD